MDQPTTGDDRERDVEPADEANDRQLEYPNRDSKRLQLREPGNSGP